MNFNNIFKPKFIKEKQNDSSKRIQVNLDSPKSVEKKGILSFHSQFSNQKSSVNNFSASNNNNSNNTKSFSERYEKLAKSKRNQTKDKLDKAKQQYQAIKDKNQDIRILKSKSQQKLGKLNTKLDYMYQNNHESDWRLRLMVLDLIDVKQSEKRNEWEPATIMEVRMNRETRDKEFLVGFRVYCDDGESEDKLGRRFNGLDQTMDEYMPFNDRRIERYRHKFIKNNQ